MIIAVIIFCCHLFMIIGVITVLQQFTNISSLDDVGKGSFFSSSSLSPLVQRTDSKQVTLGLSSCHHVILSSCCADSIEQKQWGWSWIISHSRLLSQQRYWTMKPENHFAAQWAFDQNLCTLQCNFREHENQDRAWAGNNFLSVLQRKRGSFLKNVEFCLLVAKWNIAANSRQAASLPSNHPLKFQFESKIEWTTAKASISKGSFFPKRLAETNHLVLARKEADKGC